MTTTQRPHFTRPYREWTAYADRTCDECREPIRAGERITWGRTGFAHPKCARKARA